LSEDRGERRDTSSRGNHPRADAQRGCLKDTKLTSAKSRRVGAPKPLRVLLAEDDMTNVLLATTVMEMLGCVVTTVGAGNEALRAVLHEPFDIVLMDFHMPVMNGPAATRAIREWEADPTRIKDSRNAPHMPIIAITASALPEEREECLRAGMDEILLKPFRLDHLRKVLERWAG
jgi:CheY-like chemotaxis protein